MFKYLKVMTWKVSKFITIMIIDGGQSTKRNNQEPNNKYIMCLLHLQ